jgi:hypothetical protein
MNGCQSHLKKFSAPASINTTQIMWDYAFLTQPEFIIKHGERAYAKMQTVGRFHGDDN